MKRQLRIKCPVCQVIYWSHAMRGHINGQARMEVYRWYKNRKLDMPHQKYIENNSEFIKRGIILISKN
jgi:hypothetical protein